MGESTKLSDKGMAVFAFAAYHQLEGGQPVLKVVLKDEAGHRADPEGVRELEETGLATVDEDHIVFTEAGLIHLARTIEAMKAVPA